jgi:D-threo-aldose 1-dehydrogenase
MTPMDQHPAAGPLARETRRIGSTDVQVSRLSLGSAPLGGMGTSVPDEVATAVVQSALDAGLTYVDTAPHYGRGVAEQRLRRALAGRPRDSFVLSTKVGRLIEPVDGPADTTEFQDAGATKAVFDFSADGVKRSLSDSLERLGLDRVDVVLIHDPDDYADQAISEAYPVLAEWRDQGVVGAIGVGMNQGAVPTRFVRETDIDCVLLAGRYTLIDQAGQADILPAAAERGVSIIIGGVFNSGVLADPRPDATFNYSQAPADLIERARAIRDVCTEHGVTLPAAALRFPQAHPAVATVLMGARSTEEVAANLAAFDAEIPPALWSDLGERGLLPEAEVDLRTGGR